MEQPQLEALAFTTIEQIRLVYPFLVIEMHFAPVPHYPAESNPIPNRIRIIRAPSRLLFPIYILKEALYETMLLLITLCVGQYSSSVIRVGSL